MIKNPGGCADSGGPTSTLCSSIWACAPGGKKGIFSHILHLSTCVSLTRVQSHGQNSRRKQVIPSIVIKSRLRLLGAWQTLIKRWVVGARNRHFIWKVSRLRRCWTSFPKNHPTWVRIQISFTPKGDEVWLFVANFEMLNPLFLQLST